MRSLVDIVSSSILESANHTLDDYERMVKGILRSAEGKDISEEIFGDALKKCAGYIIESYVKFIIQMHMYRDEEHQEANKTIDTDEPGFPKIYDDGDTWYDFSIRGDKFEIKSFQKGKKYSNTKLTKAQVEHKNDLIFVLCEYEVTNDKLTLTNVEFVEGKDMKISGNRMVKK